MKLNRLFAGIAATAVAAASLAAVSYAADATGTPGQAGIAFAAGNWTAQNWFDGNEYDSKATTAIVTGDGTYTVSVTAASKITDEETGTETVTEGTTGLDFAALQIVDGETLFPGMIITIDSVKIDGVEQALTSKTYTSSDEKITTRVNLYNEWVPTPPDDARTIDGDISGATAQPLSKDLGDWTTMEVTFTVSGANAAATEAPATTAEAPAAGDVAAATDSSKGSPDTGIEDVAVIAGLAVLAGGAALVAGKRK